MFLDYSTRSKTRSAEPYPVVKVPGPTEVGPTTCRPGRTRRPAFRWSVASREEDTDQGLDERWWIRSRWFGRVIGMSGFFSYVAGEGIGWWRRGDSNS